MIRDLFLIEALPNDTIQLSGRVKKFCVREISEARKTQNLFFCIAIIHMILYAQFFLFLEKICFSSKF